MENTPREMKKDFSGNTELQTSNAAVPGKTFPLLSSFLILLLHSFYTALSFLRVPLNSDHANQVLQAADILGGNIFLKGWNLTGVSFYFSELPFYVLGTVITGVDTCAYIIAASLMVICLSVLGYCLAFRDHGSQPVSKVMFYLALTGFPTLNLLGYLRGHCAIFVYFFLLLLSTKHILAAEKVPVRSWILIVILTACGCMSDMQLLIIAVIPIILFCAVNLLRNDSRFSRRKTSLLCIISLIGTGAGMVLDKLLMMLGGINKNSFLDTRKFVDMDALEEKFKLFGKGILTVFRFDISSEALTFRDFFALLFTAVILLTALVFLISTLRRYLKEGSGDAVSVVLSLSLVVMMLICFFTDIYTADDSARYIAYLPFAAGVLICRGLERRHGHFSLPACVLVFLAAGLLFAGPLSLKRIETPQDRLAAFLLENGLSEGYADFWNASHTTVASNGRVKVRAIRGQVPELGKPDYLEMQNWFCKTDWYRTGSHNFIVFDGKGYLHVSEDVVTLLLGDPDHILENNEYRIYIYDRDLTKEIVLPGNIAR